jgi:ATP synthase protein I
MSATADRVPDAMAQTGPDTPSRQAHGDPWQGFGYLVAGVLFYGFLGWLADRWLDTHLLVVVGILIGAGLGIYMTFGRFGHHDQLTKEPEE